ncbi:MAG: hypothetical protein DRP45_11575 [Candidatus Zixiibacteriota bacterium]|nr:MAG: hypothetical protein DRP45_11575 [candidate division Zixibacteria bacterium]
MWISGSEGGPAHKTSPFSVMLSLSKHGALFGRFTLRPFVRRRASSAQDDSRHRGRCMSTCAAIHRLFWQISPTLARLAIHTDYPVSFYVDIGNSLPYVCNTCAIAAVPRTVAGVIGEGGNMANGFKPRVLICSECGEEFAFTVAAQEYFAERGYTEDPKKCKACYTQYKKTKRDSGRSTPVSSSRYQIRK